MFLDLIELEKSDSQIILDTLLGCMKKHGMDSDYLQEYLICFASMGICYDWKGIGYSHKIEGNVSKCCFLALF